MNENLNWRGRRIYLRRLDVTVVLGAQGWLTGLALAHHAPIAGDRHTITEVQRSLLAEYVLDSSPLRGFLRRGCGEGKAGTSNRDERPPVCTNVRAD
jgi:hypothetical protein